MIGRPTIGMVGRVRVTGSRRNDCEDRVLIAADPDASLVRTRNSLPADLGALAGTGVRQHLQRADRFLSCLPNQVVTGRLTQGRLAVSALADWGP